MTITQVFGEPTKPRAVFSDVMGIPSHAMCRALNHLRDQWLEGNLGVAAKPVSSERHSFVTRFPKPIYCHPEVMQERQTKGLREK